MSRWGYCHRLFPARPHAGGDETPALTGSPTLPLVLHRRGSGYDAQAADAREVGDERLGHAVSKVSMVRIPGKVVERKDREGDALSAREMPKKMSGRGRPERHTYEAP